MNANLDWHLTEFIGTGIGMGNLPVVVLRKAEEHFKDELNKWEIRKWYTEYKQHMKVWEYCLTHGHNIIKGESIIGPESGTEYLECGRCGHTEVIRWY